MAMVIALGFSGLVLITALSYRNAPPILVHVVNAQSALVFSADGVSEGQAVFLRYSLMDNVFIVVSAVPLVIVTVKAYWNLRAAPREGAAELPRLA